MPQPQASCGTVRRYRKYGCRCDPCCKAYEEWYAINGQANRDRARAWRLANPNQRKVQTAKYREKHREEKNAKDLAYYHKRMAEDPESIRRNRREWAKTPQGRIANRLARHTRRGAASDREYVEIILRDPCAYCGGVGGEVDHILPLAAGGDGHWENLTPACRRCNARKNDRKLLQFLQ